MITHSQQENITMDFSENSHRPFLPPADTSILLTKYVPRMAVISSGAV